MPRENEGIGETGKDFKFPEEGVKYAKTLTETQEVDTNPEEGLGIDFFAKKALLKAEQLYEKIKGDKKKLDIVGDFSDVMDVMRERIALVEEKGLADSNDEKHLKNYMNQVDRWVKKVEKMENK